MNTQMSNGQTQSNGQKKGPGFFTRFANQTARVTGTSSTFVIAVGIILVWAVSGPLFHYSDTWQLVINTGTTIVTFLMVFLIQNTQNRDSAAMHLKIDELIRATRGAKNALIDLEDMTQEELDAFKEKFAKLAEKGRLKDPIEVQEAIEEAIEDSVEPGHPAGHAKVGASR